MDTTECVSVSVMRHCDIQLEQAAMFVMNPTGYMPEYRPKKNMQARLAEGNECINCKNIFVNNNNNNNIMSYSFEVNTT